MKGLDFSFLGKKRDSKSSLDKLPWFMRFAAFLLIRPELAFLLGLASLFFAPSYLTPSPARFAASNSAPVYAQIFIVLFVSSLAMLCKARHITRDDFFGFVFSGRKSIPAKALQFAVVAVSLFFFISLAMLLNVVITGALLAMAPNGFKQAFAP